MMWFLIGFGVLVAAFAIRDLLRRPDKEAKPDFRPPRSTGDTNTDWARAWDGLNGGGNSGSNGGGTGF